MKRIFTVVIIALVTLSASAQSYGEFMNKIIEKSPQVKSLRLNYSADSLALRQGLNPDDPEIEFEYLMGDAPATEVTFSQTFDFPTVYRHRNKSAKYSIEKAYIQLQAQQRVTMLEASDLYQTLVYTMQLEKLVMKRSQNLTQMDSLQQLLRLQGASTILESTKIELMVVEADNALKQVQTEKQNILEALKQYGAVDVDVSVDFGNFGFSGTKEEFVMAAKAGDWERQAVEMDSLIAERDLKVAQNQWIPKLKVGYRVVLESSQTNSVMVAGISVPLWNNRNNVKYSKARIVANKANLELTETTLNRNLNALYENYILAKENNNRWNNRDFTTYELLLEKAFNNGSITAMEYLLELTSYQSIQGEMLAAKYQQAMLESQMAIYLM